MQVLEKAFLKGEVDIITSKSVGHRALICSALSEKPTMLRGLNFSDDIIATKRCLIALGVEFFNIDDNTVKIFPLNQTKIARAQKIKNKLYCGESGATLRFLLPIVAALNLDSDFICEGRLPKRPMDELVSVMQKNGAKIKKTDYGWECTGEIKQGVYDVGNCVSSQYISGLLMSLPLLNGQSSVVRNKNIESLGYIDLTIDILNKFGVNVDLRENEYIVNGNDKYISPAELTIEGDWSNAAFFIAAGALNGELSIKGLNFESKQPDKKILEIIKEMGADIKVENKIVTIKKSKLSAIDIDAKQIPDLIPVLAIVAGVAKGKTIIRNAGRLRLKESDRLSVISNIINKLGGSSTLEGDNLIIKGTGCSYDDKLNSYKSAEISSENDHRIAMSLAVASTICESKLTIIGDESVNKSYPEFFDVFKGLKSK